MLPSNTYNYAISTSGYLSFVGWGAIPLARLLLALPSRNQGRLEIKGFAMGGIAILALLTVSVLGLTAPAQIFSFAFAVTFVLVMVLLSWILVSRREVTRETGIKQPATVAAPGLTLWWAKIAGARVKK